MHTGHAGAEQSADAENRIAEGRWAEQGCATYSFRCRGLPSAASEFHPLVQSKLLLTNGEGKGYHSCDTLVNRHSVGLLLLGPRTNNSVANFLSVPLRIILAPWCNKSRSFSSPRSCSLLPRSQGMSGPISCCSLGSASCNWAAFSVSSAQAQRTFWFSSCFSSFSERFSIFFLCCMPDSKFGDKRNFLDQAVSGF